MGIPFRLRLLEDAVVPALPLLPHFARALAPLLLLLASMVHAGIPKLIWVEEFGSVG